MAYLNELVQLGQNIYFEIRKDRRNFFPINEASMSR